MWAKFAAERMQTAVTMQLLPGHVKCWVATPHIRTGLLDATRPIRKENGCDTRLNEYYLLHGLGSPGCIQNGAECAEPAA